MIPFNKPCFTGNETSYIRQAVESGHISGNGLFTNKCQKYFEEKYNFKKCLLTTSCTDALEMAAMLCDIKTGDEVIMPSFTFVSTALAFVRQGASIRFVDSRVDHPGMDETKVASLINKNTKAIVVVHYAGIACDMDKIMKLAEEHNLFVIEDAAQSIDSFYKGQPLGSIGHLGCFSFHETKNIQCGEGGMIVINDDRFLKRSEILWEKGTNRAEFFRGEVNKYGWVDTGSSFLPSDVTAAFLMAQCENIEIIQNKRKSLWNLYNNGLESLSKNGHFQIPEIPDYATNNAHMFYLVCKSNSERTRLIEHLKKNDIYSVFHYQSLHKSDFYKSRYDGPALIQADRYSDCLLRLPMYFELTDEKVKSIVASIQKGMH